MTEDEKAIQAIVKQLENAWNAGNSEGFAAPFAEDASFIHIYGGHADGRAVINSSHRHIFDTVYKNSTVHYTLEQIRFVRPDVAIVLCRAHLKYFQDDQPQEVKALPSFFMAKDNGTWQIVAFQNTRQMVE